MHRNWAQSDKVKDLKSGWAHICNCPSTEWHAPAFGHLYWKAAGIERQKTAQPWDLWRTDWQQLYVRLGDIAEKSCLRWIFVKLKHCICILAPDQIY